jgi:hypothetical protein
MEDKDNPVITDGLAVEAMTLVEMGADVQTVREKLVARWVQLGRPPGVFLGAARAMSALPQPPVESVQATERAAPVRAMLGVTSAEESLVAQLSGREILEGLAGELG